MGDFLLTITEAKELIGCARLKVFEWIDEGKLLAIDIRTDGSERPHWRISKASALAMRTVCRRGAKKHAFAKKKKEKLSRTEQAAEKARRLV